jgi:outer membrane protein assembly factor BamB
MKKILPPLLTALTACLGAWLLLRWVAGVPQSMSIRGAAGAGSIAEALAEKGLEERESDLAGCFLASPEVPAGTLRGFWPGFRGTRRDNIADPGATLLQSWPPQGPKVLWEIAAGDGHAMPSLHAGTLYLLDYDEARRGDNLRALNADTGRERWHHLYAVRTKRNHGISRTVAACDGRFVVSIGPQCHVLCLEADGGKYRWGFSMKSRFGTEVPLWYTGQCPLIDNGAVILAPVGSETLLCGIDIETGATLFETPQPGGLKMSHSSVMPFTADGVRQYIYAALGGIVGIAAEGEERGRILWKTEGFTASVIAPSPVILDQDRFFMTAGYGYGGVMYRIERESGTWQARELFRTSRREFASEQQTPVYLNGLLYTVLPSDGGGNRQQLVCMTPEGEVLWSSGKEERFGLGPYLATPDEHMFLLDDAGTLTLAKIGREGYRRLARFELMDKSGRDAWGPLLLADGRLFVRDSTRIYSIEVGR